MKPPTPTTTPMMVLLVLELMPLLPEEPLSVREPDLVGLAAELVDDEEALEVGLLSTVDEGVVLGVV